MNWFKRAQYENASIQDITVELSRLIPIYRELIDKSWENTLTPEEKTELQKTHNQIRELNRTREEKIKQQKEITKQRLQQGKAHEVHPLNFLSYHQTGSIAEDFYDIYKTKEGISWLGTPDKYPILLDRKKYGNEIIEFRKKDEKIKYIQSRNPKDPNSDFLRDENGNLIYLTEQQTKEKELPIYDTTIVAFNQDKEAIGWASDEFGADGVFVVEEYQGKGIGNELLYLFRKQFKPERRMGQMTPLGKTLAKAYHKRLVQEALEKGEYVPKEILEFYDITKQ
jgi:GNAT superfamily N-acetyltransferase